MSLPATAARFAPWAQGVLRIVAGYLFAMHGSSKLFHVPHVSMFDHVSLLSLMGLAGVIELAGGVLMVLGLQTRLTAFVLSGEMAFAYFSAHAPHGNPLVPLANGGELAALYGFLFLFFAAAGAGAASLDGKRR